MSTSSTTKKASTGAKKPSSAAKKPSQPKPKPAPAPVAERAETPIAPAAPVPEAPKTLQELERIAAIEGKKAEQNVKKAMQDDDLVMIQVPPDPRGEIMVFDRTFNGIEVKLNAGEMRELPRFLANAVMKSMKLQVLSDKKAAKFANGNGVDLTRFMQTND